LGSPYTLTISVANGVITVYYEGLSGSATTHIKAKSAASVNYFKAGCYTQSNVSKGDAASAYGEVWISTLGLEHIK
jgi:poly(beta-D-mannuronate) lyase